MVDHRKMWQELWWKMADGNVTGYREIKRMDVMEFWGFFDRWRDRTKQEIDRLRARTNKH
jgi:hypothetical protein